MKRKFLLIALLTVVSFGYSQKKWSLRECVDTALNKNITIQQNKLNLLLAEKDVAIAKGNFLPNLSASTSGNLSAGSNFNPVTNNRTSSQTFFWRWTRCKLWSNSI
jgi:outer membrane protein